MQLYYITSTQPSITIMQCLNQLLYSTMVVNIGYYRHSYIVLANDNIVHYFYNSIICCFVSIAICVRSYPTS